MSLSSIIATWSPPPRSFEGETATDFWEVGASGRRYSRETVGASLAARHAAGTVDEAESAGWQVSDAQLRRAGLGAYLLTYTLRQGDRLTRRLTVWQGSIETGWSAVYHQGRVVQPE